MHLRDTTLVGGFDGSGGVGFGQVLGLAHLAVLLDTG